MKYLAHMAPDGRKQTVREHLQGTASRSAAFASSFGAEEHGRLVGLAHDIGKYTSGFQKRLQGGKKVDHATAGAIECARMNHIYGACAVIGHHGGLPDMGNINTDLPGDATCFGRLKKGLSGGIEAYEMESVLPKSGVLPHYCNDNLAMSFWTRMLFSCLVDGDYLDTEAFMSNGKVCRPEYDSLAALLERLEKYIAPWQNPTTPLNRSRTAILRECMEAASRERGLFSLTVPTGGGKTIASLAFALRHAVELGLRRVIYVIPYTSIIEQNADVFRRILGENNVLEHHSGVLFDSDEDIPPEKRRLALAAENWDAPVIVTTAVQFFESMYANRPSQCRKLHNIANSVIIFDEAQMIPMVHLRPCVAAIAHLVRDFRCSGVLCTATQPFLNDLFAEFAPGLSVTELCPHPEQMVEQFRRVAFRQMGKCDDETLAALLAAEHQVLCIVNSRKAAQELFALLPEEGRFHLSTLMYPAHRQKILAEIRRRLKNGELCRVVSTSLIEAGVDVDFPAVYREMAGLDSILQAAGRCNREGKRTAQSSIVTVFHREAPAPPLFQMNIGAAVEAMAGGDSLDRPDTISHYFRSLRAFVGSGVDKTHTVDALKQGISGCQMPFRTVAEHFRLIDNATKTIYLPLGEGAEPVRRILAGEASLADFRLAGRCSVAVYEQHFAALLRSGGLLPLGDGESAVLSDLRLYDEQMGLSLEADSGYALFI